LHVSGAGNMLDMVLLLALDDQFFIDLTASCVISRMSSR